MSQRGFKVDENNRREYNMAIHNAIFDGEELQRMKSVTRFEVIDDTGRAYVKYRNKDEKIKYDLQDDDRTLKVFIDKRDEDL